MRISMPRRTSLALLVAVLGTSSLSACGDYLACDEQVEGGKCAVIVAGGGGVDSAAFGAATSLDHLGLSAILRHFSKADSKATLVDYQGIAESPEARYELSRYIAGMAAVDPSKLDSPAERFAFWVNSYNAHVVQGVIDNFAGSASYKVTDTGEFFSRLVSVGGTQLSLDQLENVVVRGDTDHASVKNLATTAKARFATWHKELWEGKTVDPRLHAAFNCGAISCPNLLASEPFVYRASILEDQLAANAKAWVNADKGASADGISQLFDWYKKDFDAADGSVAKFIDKHRDKGLDGVDTSRFLDYDWTLNILMP